MLVDEFGFSMERRAQELVLNKRVKVVWLSGAKYPLVIQIKLFIIQFELSFSREQAYKLFVFLEDTRLD